jgi:transcriptional regulator with AAA-type ATPase domain
MSDDKLPAVVEQFAMELNNIARTLRALIEIMDVDQEALTERATEIFREAIQQAQEDAKEEDAPQPEITREQVEASGAPAAHPQHAVIFGGND